VLHFFSWLLASIGYATCSEDRQVALANLDLAFGDAMSPEEKRRIARASFDTLARNLCDLVWAGGAKPEALLNLVDFSDAHRFITQELQVADKGIVFILPHLGSWELGGLACGLIGIPLTTIAEPGTNPHIDDMITIARRSTGHKIVPPRNSMLTMVRAAMRRQPVALFIDVNARRGRGGIWLDFFGVPVYQSVAAAELAIRSNGKIVCSLPSNEPGGRVRVQFLALIDAADTIATDHEGRVRELSEKTLRVYEAYIREHPDQWLWTYKRWKRRPCPERGKYPFYSKYYPETPAEKSVEAS